MFLLCVGLFVISCNCIGHIVCHCYNCNRAFMYVYDCIILNIYRLFMFTRFSIRVVALVNACIVNKTLHMHMKMLGSFVELTTLHFHVYRLTLLHALFAD